jgi:hypothetical protein
MEAMDRFVDASFEVIRAGFAPDADDAARKRAASACLALHTMLSPARILPLSPDVAPAPASAEEPDVLDTIMTRLQAFISTAPVGFNLPNMPGAK